MATTVVEVLEMVAAAVVEQALVDLRTTRNRLCANRHVATTVATVPVPISKRKRPALVTVWANGNFYSRNDDKFPTTLSYLQ